MTMFEIAFNFGCLLSGAASILYLTHVVRVSGRESQCDPVRVKRIIDTAPYERLDNILSK